MPNLIASIDLGQTTDFTAYAVIEQADGESPIYSCRRLVRFDLRTPYPVIVRYVVDQHSRTPLAGVPLVIDQTGVGRPVVEMFAAAGVNALITPITITGGNRWHREANGDYKVPKTDLVGVMQMLLPSDRFKAALNLGIRKDGSGQNLSGLLIEEMQNFRVKVSMQAHEIYGAREGKHDDILLSVALGCWYAENNFVGEWDATPDPRSRSIVDKAPPGLWLAGPDADDGSAQTPAW